MTSPSVIFFKTILCFCALAASQLQAADVTGQVRIITSEKSPSSKNSDASGVVVWLTSPAALNMHPAAARHVSMLQKGKRFVPHILAIETGTSVDFPNLDPIFHNAFSNFDGQIFDVALYAPGTSKSVRFNRPGIVRVFCNIHPSMSAIIVVVNSRHFTMTDRNGSFRLENVPPGDFELHFFAERSTPEALQALVRTISIPDDREVIQLPETAIAEAAYLPSGHKNKYGRDYPASSYDTDTYTMPLK